MRLLSICSGVAILAGCATPSFIYEILPPVYKYSSNLVPGNKSVEDPAYTVNEDGSITFDRGGLRVTARPLSDVELNRRYPEVSYQDRFSANPFTYGNWRDPQLGYTPNRFTVFGIEVFNPVLPKVELLPSRTALRTDRGEEFTYYSINREESERSFEEYYTLIRGPGGNEQYRFDQRMSIVREELYRLDHQVFKGDDYRGFLVFAPLDEEVKSVELRIKDFAVQFEVNHATQTIDLIFHFDHEVEKRKLEGEEARRARQRDWILPERLRDQLELDRAGDLDIFSGRLGYTGTTTVRLSSLLFGERSE